LRALSKYHLECRSSKSLFPEKKRPKIKCQIKAENAKIEKESKKYKVGSRN